MSGPGAAARTALVSGASRGIGLAIVRAFVSEGIRVAMVARGADELSMRAGELGELAFPLACDVGDIGAVQRAASSARERFGGAPDILVNNAGFFFLATLDRTAPDALARLLDVNLLGAFSLVHTVLPAMRERGSGHVVTIGSISDHIAFRQSGAYSMSKFALRALHETLRAELRGSGVRTTLVSPAQVNTAIWDPVDPDSRPGFTPRHAMLSADAVAAAVVYAVTQPPAVNVDELRLSRA